MEDVVHVRRLIGALTDRPIRAQYGIALTETLLYLIDLDRRAR